MKYSKLNYPVLVASFAVLILIWELVAYFSNNAQLVPGPLNVWQEFTRLFSDPALTSELLSGIQSTMVAVLLGFSLSAIVGVPLGFLMGRYLVVDRFLEPWVTSWYSIPAIAFVPLTMNWTGITWESAAITSFLVAVFSIIINVYSGVRHVSRQLEEPALAFGATESQLLYKVVLPASLPNIMVGLRLGITRAIEGVIIAEMVFTVVGLGGMIDGSADKLQLALSYALIGILVAITMVLNEAMKVINRRVVQWQEAQAMFRG
ncbi:MAG: ABC transporter permease [Thaumarchaeota archaeon]|nr:ABC transporter permease [Nitrososphaerota archaeon]